jgi:hypothetical protein
LDSNGDTAICKYELRYAVHDAISSDKDQANEKYGEKLIVWLKSFVGEITEKVPLHVLKLYQLFDEDINGKITWVRIITSLNTSF